MAMLNNQRVYRTIVFIWEHKPTNITGAHREREWDKDGCPVRKFRQAAAWFFTPNSEKGRRGLEITGRMRQKMFIIV